MRAPHLLFVLMLAVPAPVAAQWYVGIEWAANRYGGTSRDTSSTHLTGEGRPGGGTAAGLRIGWNGRRVGAALLASHAYPGFTITGHDITVSDHTTGRLYEAALVLSTRVGGIGPSGAIRAELGPALHLWDYDGKIRARVGALGAAAYEWPVAGRFSGAVRLEGAASKSWFDADELPPEFVRRLTWRYGVTLALRYRL